MLNLGNVEIPWEADESLVPLSLRPLLDEPQQYAIAGRNPLTKPFFEQAHGLRIPRRMWSRSYGNDGIGQLRVKAIEPGDFHFYAAELEAVRLPNPAFLLKLLYGPMHGRVAHTKAEWLAMLAIISRLASDSEGIVYRTSGDRIRFVDFKPTTRR